MYCLACNGKKINLIWNDKIRSARKKFTKNNEKIYQCQNCELVFLKKKRKILEDSGLSRKLYNKDNSINEFFNFHTPRELKKLDLIKKHINFKNKQVLESNCGAGIIINNLRKISKLTVGVDNSIYKKFLEENGHLFFKDIDTIINKKIKFDVILSLSEIEHKHDPILFLKKLKKIVKKDGYIVLRIPNFYNIYMVLLSKDFFKYDYRTSHNYYFSERNLDLIFKKLNFKIYLKKGFNEYSANHLFTDLKNKKRVNGNKINNIFKKKADNLIVKNIENSKVSTSLIYILKAC